MCDDMHLSQAMLSNSHAYLHQNIYRKREEQTLSYTVERGERNCIDESAAERRVVWHKTCYMKVYN